MKPHAHIHHICHHNTYCHYCKVDFVLFHNVTCYTDSLLLCIHVNTTYLLTTMCALVAIGVILWRSRCISIGAYYTQSGLIEKDEGVCIIYLYSHIDLVYLIIVGTYDYIFTSSFWLLSQKWIQQDRSHKALFWTLVGYSCKASRIPYKHTPCLLRAKLRYGDKVTCHNMSTFKQLVVSYWGG